MRVSFTTQARDDLKSIGEWIEQRDERAADRVLSRIVQTATMLGPFPMLGWPGEIAGTREFSVVGLPYMIVYTIVLKDEVDVLTVLHTRRQYP